MMLYLIKFADGEETYMVGDSFKHVVTKAQGRYGKNVRHVAEIDEPPQEP